MNTPTARQCDSNRAVRMAGVHRLGVAACLALLFVWTASTPARAADGRVNLVEASRTTILDEPTRPDERFHDAVSSLAFAPDGSTLAAGMSNPDTILLLDPENLQVRARLKGHHGLVSRLSFSPDGATLASAGHDGTVRLWDVASGRERLAIEHLEKRVRGLALSPDGKRLYSGEMGVLQKGRGQAWDAEDGKLLGTFESGDRAVADIALSADGSKLATTTREGSIRLWDATTYELKGVYSDDSAYSNSIAFTPDGRSLAAVFYKDATLRLFDVATMREQRRVETQAPFFLALDVSPDGEILATADLNRVRIQLWRASDGTPVGEVPDAGMVIAVIKFSPDGRSLAVGGTSGALKTFRLDRQGE